MGTSEILIGFLGFVGGILVDWLFKEPVLEYLKRRSIKHRALRVSKNIKCNSGINLGLRNTNTYLIEGNGVEEILEPHIAITIKDEYKDRLDVVGDFNNWSFSPPPNQVNGLPINLFVITADDKILYTQRSQAVAIAPGVLSASINENIHPIEDVKSDKRTIDFQRFVRRGLYEELGWNDDAHGDHTDLPKAKVKILGFIADSGSTSYGIVGYVELPITADHVEQMKETMAKDRREIAGLVAVDFNFEALTEFIHKNAMYDAIGITACLCLIYREHKTWQEIDKRFRELQSGA